MRVLLRWCAVASIIASLAGLFLADFSYSFAAAPDYDVPGGHFFTQTGGGSGAGYYVLDAGQDARGNAVRYWSEFRRLGGVDTLGYPNSRWFIGAGGFVYQSFQRGVLQWRPETGSAVLANTFEWLQQAGRDDWLYALGVPRPIADDGSGGDWSKARGIRLGWLTEARIKAKFLARPTAASGAWTVEDSIQLYGLPMSRPERRGPFVVQRFQRIAFQLWVDEIAGMPPPGAVVGVLGGDLLKQAGVIPADAAAAEQPNGPRSVPDSRGGGRKDVKAIKGLYVSYFAAGQERYRQRVLDLAATTEINALVVDVKGDRGFTTHRSEVPLAKGIGAGTRPTVSDVAALVRDLHQRGVYVIGRVVVFKDDPLATSRPALAVIDARTGAPWRDSEGLAWTDPFREEVWSYNIALAKEAARLGYDEIQFDYVRFPTDGATGAARFAKPTTMESRMAAINGFLARARAELGPLGVKLSADTFGYTAWRQDDMGIGQKIEDMARYLDALSPMLYPSTFQGGIPGYQPGVVYPYETVYYSTQKAVSRLSGMPVVVRPWLQDFPDYSYDRRAYTAKEVTAQIRGAKDGGAVGWLLWDPRIGYTREALASE